MPKEFMKKKNLLKERLYNSRKSPKIYKGNSAETQTPY